MTIARTPWWAWTWPVLAWVILSVTPLASPAGFIAAAAGMALILAVFAAVYHAEVVAHRTGEPFGTLVLAVAVTIIEVALIVSVMVAARLVKELKRPQDKEAVPGLPQRLSWDEFSAVLA